VALGLEDGVAISGGVGSGCGIADFVGNRLRGRSGRRRDRTGTATQVAGELTTGGAKDMTGAVVGLMTLLLALVLGLLIWTAYGVYSTQKTAVQTVATTDLKLAEAFQDYGPDAAEGQRILRDGIQDTMAKIWGDHDVDEEAVIHRFGYARAHLKARIAFLNTLKPATDQQTAAKVEAMQAEDSLAPSSNGSHILPTISATVRRVRPLTS